MTPAANRWSRLEESPVQLAGVTDAYTAMLAERAGFRALYLSGSGVATAAFGLPDLGLTTLTEVAGEARRITAATSLPLLVDADTGWGSDPMVERAVRELERVGAAAIQLEDQVAEKRCGHRPNKRLAETAEMVGRIAAAVSARASRDFAVVARTDALAGEGLAATVSRARSYAEAGADIIFLEGAGELRQYSAVAAATGVPVLANLTEFGVTPLFTVAELAAAGVPFALYPLSAFRAMSAAAVRVFAAIRADGTQAAVVPEMQTRAELYDVLDYVARERQADLRAAGTARAGPA
jgi:methylisocitrate lyase